MRGRASKLALSCEIRVCSQCQEGWGACSSIWTLALPQVSLCGLLVRQLVLPHTGMVPAGQRRGGGHVLPHLGERGRGPGHPGHTQVRAYVYACVRVCGCMCVCMRVGARPCMRARACMPVCARVCMCERVREGATYCEPPTICLVCEHASSPVCMCTCVYACVCMCVHVRLLAPCSHAQPVQERVGAAALLCIVNVASICCECMCAFDDLDGARAGLWSICRWFAVSELFMGRGLVGF